MWTPWCSLAAKTPSAAPSRSVCWQPAAAATSSTSAMALCRHVLQFCATADQSCMIGQASCRETTGADCAYVREQGTPEENVGLFCELAQQSAGMREAVAEEPLLVA